MQSTCYERTLKREYGSELCRVVSTANCFHPIALHFGGAIVVLPKHEALGIAHALVCAVQSLPKGV